MIEQSDTPTYCTPEDVARYLRMRGDDRNGQFMFSDQSDLTYDQVVDFILDAEDEVDYHLEYTYRCGRHEGQIIKLDGFWGDTNGPRYEYYRHGGYHVQLERFVKRWDPSQGDRLEIDLGMTGWRDITGSVTDDGCAYPNSVDIDYEDGVMRIRDGSLFFNTPRDARIRITYRYGADHVPRRVRKLCIFYVLMTVLATNNYDLAFGRAGPGGDSRTTTMDWLKGEIARLTAEIRGVTFGRIGL